MPFTFMDLDDRTRSLMVQEFEDDRSMQRLYISPRLNTQGQHQYPDLLAEALIAHTPEWLAEQMRANHLFNTTESRHTSSGRISIAKVPSTASDTLSEGEFNRYYMRAICRRAIDDKITHVQVYRAKPVQQARSASQAKVGALIDPTQLLHDLRTHQGTDTALGLPPGPNSGLSIKLHSSQSSS